jgi:hypothetical protein
MTQQDKQMRVGARVGFQDHSQELVLLASCNRFDDDLNTSFVRNN